MRMASRKKRLDGVCKEMECPVCFDYMTADIYHCANGHNVCGCCNAKLSKCPCCSLQITMRNRGLEKIAQGLSYPCIHPGCDEAYPLNELEVHQAECPFGPFKCPLSCSFKGVLDDLLTHFVLKHEHVFSDPAPGRLLANTLLDVRPRSCWDQLVVSEGAIFFCSFVYSEDTFYGYVKRVGPPDGDSYVYEMSLIGSDGTATCSMKNEVHQFADFEHEIFKSNNCLIIGKDVLQKYLDTRKRLRTTTALRCIGPQKKDNTDSTGKKLGAVPKQKPTASEQLKSNVTNNKKELSKSKAKQKNGRRFGSRSTSFQL